ncbi:hypothetical protein EDB85DRAFT_1892549 [Lactarius pseudohatsudake]|nr:hypothetical protein EDB85DRAFT_1892549 [Lactarius pseudohatsudake]
MTERARPLAQTHRNSPDRDIYNTVLDGCDSLHNVDLLTPSDTPKFPSTASSNPVPDNILPKVTPAPNASPKRTFETEPGAAGDHDSPNPGSRKEKDALDPPSANRAFHTNTTATLGLPSNPRH